MSAEALAGSVRIAVAANFKRPLAALAEQFQTDTGHTVSVTAGSSGLLHAQISRGAPFDLFLSADQKLPADLQRRGLVAVTGPVTYAIGRLILVSAKDRGLPKLAADVQPDLSDIKTLSIANPRTAPYGAAAIEVLSHLSTAPNLRIAHASSVAGVNAVVSSGAAEAGLAALSSVRGPDAAEMTGWVVPQALHAPLHQDAVLLKRAGENDAAIAFLTWLRSPAAREMIRSYGYDVD